MGLFDKLFGRKKPKDADESETAREVEQPAPPEAPRVEPQAPPRATEAAQPQPEPEAPAATPEPQESTASEPAPAEPEAAPAETLPEAREAPEPAQKEAPAPAARLSSGSHRAVSGERATVTCAGCGRELPVPLPGHPTRITCPFCATQTDYKP